MVRETRYLIVRNLPENCTEETVIDHFQRYGKIQSVKLQPAKENDAGSTATVAFNDIRSAAKAHHAKNSLGEVTLRTDYWEGSSGTAVLANPPGTPSGAANSGRATSYTSATAASSRPVSTFSSWNKGVSEDSTNSQDKGDTIQSSSSAGGGVVAPATASSALDKLPSTPLELQRSRPRERLSKKKFGQKFEKTGSFGRHGTTTSMRCLEATRSQSEAQAAAAAAAAASSGHPATPSASSSSGGGGPGSGLGCLNPIIVSDTKEGAKDSREASRSRPHSVASPSSRHSGGGAVIKKLSNSQSRSASPSRSRSRGSRSSSSHSDSTGTSRSTSPHRSHGSCNARPQSMVGASRLVTSEAKDRRDGDDGDRRPLGICVTGLPVRSTDSSLRDGLYHEYKKHGKVTTVQVFGDGENRYAVVSFRKP
ncbi:msx2-interacting protein, partial [Aplysia californica]